MDKLAARNGRNTTPPPRPARERVEIITIQNKDVLGRSVVLFIAATMVSTRY